MRKIHLTYIIPIFIIVLLILKDSLPLPSHKKENSKIIGSLNQANLPSRSKEPNAIATITSLKSEIKIKKNIDPSKSRISVAAPTRAISSSTHNEIQYEVDEDGLATIDGDIVLGTLSENTPTKGKATAPDLTLWPDGRVPFFIQGDLENPARVIKAIAMFANTPIHFVVYQGDRED